MSFTIRSLDQSKAHHLSEKLGIGDEWMKGISMEVSDQTAEKLKPLLPKRGYLWFQDDQVQMSSFVWNTLTQPMNSSEGAMQVILDDPSKQLQEATSSGDLHVSSKFLSHLFQLASKLSRIELVLDNNQLKGLLQLR